MVESVEIQRQDFPSFHDSLGPQTGPTFPQLRRRRWLIGKKRKSKNPDWAGGGKVEIQKQDSHLSTAPAACGSKEEKLGPSPTAKKGTLLSR